MIDPEGISYFACANTFERKINKASSSKANDDINIRRYQREKHVFLFALKNYE